MRHWVAWARKTVLTSFRRLRSNEDATTTVEYALALAVITMSCIVVWQTLSEIAGQSASGAGDSVSHAAGGVVVGE